MKNKWWEAFFTLLFQCLSYYSSILKKRDALSFVQAPQHKSTLLYCILPRWLKLSSHNNNCNVFHSFYLIGIDLNYLWVCFIYSCCLRVGFFFVLKHYGLRILQKHLFSCSMSQRLQVLISSRFIPCVFWSPLSDAQLPAMSPKIPIPFSPSQ